MIMSLIRYRLVPKINFVNQVSISGPSRHRLASPLFARAGRENASLNRVGAASIMGIRVACSDGGAMAVERVDIPAPETTKRG
jgi:hypothetical protein